MRLRHPGLRPPGGSPAFRAPDRRASPPVRRRRARVRIPGSPGTVSHGGEGGIRTLEAGISRLRDFQSRSFGQLGHLSVRTKFPPIRGQRTCPTPPARSHPRPESRRLRRGTPPQLKSTKMFPCYRAKAGGGEGGIRTLGTVLPVQPLSRRLPSADSATSPRKQVSCPTSPPGCDANSESHRLRRGTPP